MNEMIKTVVNDACGEDFDLFEKAFDENTAHHNFSGRHKRRMEAVFKNADNPALARKKYEAKPFFSEFGVKQFAAAAASLVVVGGLMFGGVKAVDMLSDLAEIKANTNKRYDELLKDGNYYFTTDDSIYFTVENGRVTLCGDKAKIYELYLNNKEIDEANQRDPEFIKSWVSNMIERYMSGMNYAIVEAGEGYKTDENGNVIPYDRPKYGFVNLDKCTDISWDSIIFMFDEASLMFDGENTISIAFLGDFVLAE